LIAPYVSRWQAAGLLEAGQAERILAFEAAQAAREAEGAGERPGVIEAVLYLGVAVVAVGAATLTAQNWQELRPWARIAALVGPALLLLGFGQLMRAQAQPAVRRASGVAWLAGVALIAGSAGVIGREAGWDGRDTALVAGAIAAALALALWVVQPAHTQVVALAGSLTLLAIAAGAWADDVGPDTLVIGLLLALFGATGVALTELGSLGPRPTARLLGAAGVMFGLLLAAYFGDGGRRFWVELLLFAAGAGLIALGLLRAAFTYIGIAVTGTFAGLVAFIFRHFEDQLGAPVALLLSGVLVIAAALLLAHFRGRLRAEATT